MKTLKIKTNLVFGIVAIILALVLWFIIPSQVPPSKVATEYVNGSFMPKLMSGLMLICGIIGIIKSLALKDDDVKEITINIESKNWIYLGMIVAYGLLARYFSFLVASVLFGTASLWFMKCKDVKKYIIIVVVIVAVCLIFKFGLKVRFGGVFGI